MTSVRLEHLGKRFGRTIALDDVSFGIEPGELFFLLGPSGCGKSTLLRLIAGLDVPSHGRVFFGDRDVTALPTQRRNAVMCFQSYALWPHMTVRQNILFGLRAHNFPTEQQDQRITEVLRLVQLQDYAGRRPNALSGGQQQRAALARALAVHPDCLLLDEPLSNIDAKLRLEMRGEIRRICKSAGFTTIYVTHDQKEALSIADRIALMRDGKVVQIGTPGELYYKPRTSFAADFLGQANLLPGEVIGRDAATIRVQTAVGTLSAASLDGQPASRVVLSIRPQQMRIVGADSLAAGSNRIAGKVLESAFLGETSEHVLSVNGQRLRVISSPPMLQTPAELTVEFDPADALVLTE
jgi:iron(III) transport system ATP-binding protein